ncbi:mitochondrial ornithine transporter 1 [Toxorhynchites rutilus septentrionalis]|uniref:mitochondrial ornithine transporter 1 n=1 Tax=Toxorhynchites rutilus septentrionalis TaxID=329112 RepID=UPI00247999F3|nr:mitochondrial ornithine transporter 1 [Toxorhynchites rutilus septentrionalis]
MHGKSEAGFKTGLIDFTAGSLGGVALVYVSQPMDTVKVKMQTFPHLYKNMIDCTIGTFKRDGFVRGLYAGTVPAIVANVAENSVLFAAYGACQNVVALVARKQSVAELSALDNATAGFLAAFFSSFTLCPTELIKCKLQALREVQAHNLKPNEKLPKISPFQLTKQILRSEGIPGMFRGLSSTFAREMPGYFFFFGGYEASRELMAKPGQSKDDIGPIKTMVAGAVGGVALWTSIFPADVIKSRIQVQSLTLSMTQVGIDILRKEGPLAFYNGLQPTIVRTIPATAVLFVVYEYTKKFMAELFI